MKSVHERHRLALAQLQQGVHLPVVERAARALGIDHRHPPRTLQSSLRAGPGPYAELVLAVGPGAQHAMRMQCWVSRPESDDAPYLERAGSVGWVSIAPLLDDPVAATAADLDGLDATLVRYHRASRATVRVHAPTGLVSCPVAYAKVYSNDRGRICHAVMETLSDTAATGRLNLRVAEPVAYDAPRFVLWQREVAGEPATDLLTGASGPAVAARLGAALGSLHTSAVSSPRRLTAAGMLLRADRHATEVSHLLPALGERISELLDAVVAGVPSGDGAQVPVHGSPDPAHWLVARDGVPGLVDFDSFAWGEPTYDLACFVVELEALADGLVPAAKDEFLTSYQHVAGSFDAASLRGYCGMRRVGKVLRAARALRVDGDRRAEKVLCAAERELCLAGERSGAKP